MPNYKHLIFEEPEAAICRIWLNRPESRNAQNSAMLYELNDAFDHAVAKESIKVIILAAKGPHFSSGHDMMEIMQDKHGALAHNKRVGTWSSDDWFDVEGYYAREKEIYDGFCRRWRDLSKPTIASVHGKAISGALMLIWPMDLVIASEDATFQDNTMFMGIPGVEYFAHAWELGIRRAKAFLLTGAALTAAEALQAGMVNKVVERESLEAATLELARSVADKPSFALKLGKEAINAAFAAQGFDNVQRNAFNAHHLAHTYYRFSQDGAFADRAFLDRLALKKPK